jgi:hypothetical protein
MCPDFDTLVPNATPLPFNSRKRDVPDVIKAAIAQTIV